MFPHLRHAGWSGRVLALLCSLLAMLACSTEPILGVDGRPVDQIAAAPDGALHVFVLPGVGQATLAVGPTGRTLLYDVGGDESADALLAALARFGVTRVDLVVLSHRHANHEAGIVGLAGAKLPVAAVMTSMLPSATRGAMRVEAAWRQMGAVVVSTRDTVIDFGAGATVELVRSPLDAMTDDTVVVSHDDRSTSMGITFRGRRFVAIGDGSFRLQEALLRERPGFMGALTAYLLPDAGSYPGSAFLDDACWVPSTQGTSGFAPLGAVYGRPTRDIPMLLMPAHVILSDEGSDQAFPGCYREAQNGQSVSYTLDPSTAIVAWWEGRRRAIGHATRTNGVVELRVDPSGLVRVLHDRETRPAAP